MSGTLKLHENVRDESDVQTIPNNVVEASEPGTATNATPPQASSSFTGAGGCSLAWTTALLDMICAKGGKTKVHRGSSWRESWKKG